MLRLAVIAFTALGLAACAKQEAAPAAPAAASAPPAQVAGFLASWLGRWTGPEGTYLEIAAQDGACSVTISNLDGPRSFPATPGVESLAFERDGTLETIRATTGTGTGMKWLAGKTNCLTVKPGEGFCRD